MKEKISGRLPLAACRLKLAARGLPLVACGLQLAARNRLSLGALDKMLSVLVMKGRYVYGKIFGYKFFSAGHMLHSRLKVANSSCSLCIRCFVLEPDIVCW